MNRISQALSITTITGLGYISIRFNSRSASINLTDHPDNYFSDVHCENNPLFTTVKWTLHENGEAIPVVQRSIRLMHVIHYDKEGKQKGYYY